MKVRVYYQRSGKLVMAVIVDSEDWNLLEVGTPVDKITKYATFPLTEENLNKYMDSPDIVNLEEIGEYEGKL